MTIKHRGEAMFIDDDPAYPEDPQAQRIRRKAWRPGLPEFFRKMKIYAYVEFPSLERYEAGLAAIEGDPKTGKWLDSIEITYGAFETPRAPLTEYGEAFDAIEEEEGWMLEEFPFVEIKNKKDYVGAAKLTTMIESPEENWDGPGVYDLHDRPFTKQYDSVEEYELASLEDEAEHLVDFIFQGEEWKQKLVSLLETLEERAGTD